MNSRQHNQKERLASWLRKANKYSGWAQADEVIQSRDVFEIDHPETIRHWEFRIAVRPTADNLRKATVALYEVMGKDKYSDIEFKCFSLSETRTTAKQNEFLANSWDGTTRNEGDTDRDQRGKEICVYMTYLSSENKYYFSPEEWKELMLDCWQALEKAGVEGIGYAPCPYGDKQVNGESKIMTPFTYTAFKPFQQRHGLLFQGNPNPYNHPDPLEGITITREDLEARNISDTGITKKNYVRAHAEASLLKNMDQLLKLQVKVRAGLSEDPDELINKLLNKDDYDPKSDYFTIEKIIKLLPATEKCQLEINPLAGELRLTFNKMQYDKFEDCLTRIKGYLLSDSYKEQLMLIMEDYKSDNNVANLLKELDIDDHTLAELIRFAPNEMQRLYRNLIHTSHELNQNNALNQVLQNNLISECHQKLIATAGFYNPLRELFETRNFIGSHAYRTSFAQKVLDTFYIFSGSFFDNTHRNHLGIYDYLTLGIPYLLGKASFYINNSTLAMLPLIPAIILNIPRYIFSAIFAVACLPFTAIAHGISRIKGSSMEETAKSIKLNTVHNSGAIPEHPLDRSSTQLTLQQFLVRNNLGIDEISIDIIGNYHKFDIIIGDTIRQGAASAEYHAATSNTASYAVIRDFDPNASEENRKQFDALLALNLGNISSKLEAKNYQLQFFHPAKPVDVKINSGLSVDTNNTDYHRRMTDID